MAARATVWTLGAAAKSCGAREEDSRKRMGRRRGFKAGTRWMSWPRRICGKLLWAGAWGGESKPGFSGLKEIQVLPCYRTVRVLDGRRPGRFGGWVNRE